VTSTFQFAAVAKAIGKEHRLEQGGRSVEPLAGRSGLSIANASQHLQHLHRAGLVTARRHAKFVPYRLAYDAVLTMLSEIHRVAERNVGEVECILRSYFNSRDDLAPVRRAELQRRMKQGLVTVLDVRPEEEFELAHLPGTRNIALSQLKRQLAKLDRKTEKSARRRFSSISWRSASRCEQPPYPAHCTVEEGKALCHGRPIR
jgi:DNA-binding transcriptional ArsR family regulator